MKTRELTGRRRMPVRGATRVGRTWIPIIGPDGTLLGVLRELDGARGTGRPGDPIDRGPRQRLSTATAP